MACAQLFQLSLGEMVGRERALFEQLLEAVGDVVVDDLLHLGPSLGQFAVAGMASISRSRSGVVDASPRTSKTLPP